MWIIPLACYVITLGITLFGIQFHINLVKYPLYLSIPLTLAVLMPLSIIFILPIDYVQSNSSITLDWLQNNVILILWKSNYWITFLLTWLILPQLQEFFKSGYFTFNAKMIDSFKKNLKYQLILLAISIIGIVYLILEVGLTINHLKLMVIALAHIYSLILALWLMSHGLITIPRNKWIEGNILNNLNHHYLKLPKLIDNLEDVKIEFKEDILKVLILTENFTSTNNPQDFKFRDWILKLNSSIPSNLKDLVKRQYVHETLNSQISRDQLTLSYMYKLTTNFNSNLRKFQAYESEFESLFIKITHLEDILESKTSNSSELNFRINNYRVLLSPKLNFIYWYYIRSISSRILSIIYYGMAFIILQSEFFHSTQFSIINFIFSKLSLYPILQVILTSIFFSFMLFASLNSLTQLKIFNMYHLVPHNSDPVSACFYTTYIARLTIPLSYNFITLFISRNSNFENWFGQSIHLTGLFNLMNNWLPRLLLIPVLLTVFNIYDKLKKRIGLGDIYDSWVLFDDDNESGSDNHNDVENNDNNLINKRKDLIIVEAKRIVNRELQKRQNQQTLRPFNLSSSVDSTNSTNHTNLSAADINYENNRRSFHDSLVNDTSNRIDFAIDDENEPFILDPTQQSNVNRTTIWGRVNGLFSGFTNRFNQSAAVEYRDEPLENFHYDDDADENLVV